MDRKTLVKNYICNAMTESQFLREIKVSKADMKIGLEGAGWACFFDRIDEAFDEEGRSNALVIEEFATEYIEDLRKAPEEGWCRYSYKWILNSIFSEMPKPSSPEVYGRGTKIFLQLVRGIFRFEEQTLPFDPTKSFQMISDEDVLREGYTAEYIKLKHLSKTKYIYEFMRMGIDITPFNTLGHIGGVHYIAMLVATQLRRSGVDVDLGLISGAAASHDIGKYGCKKSEEKRIPYLHYYYTNLCMNKFDMPSIGHIASNHSTWDLELENLPVESLILIYADFRVKSTRSKETGKELVHFYSLAQSYNVILNKLDNVDEAKKHRYSKVYNKLKDFEDYMIEQGVHTEVPSDYSMYEDVEIVPAKRDVVLLHGDKIVEQLKFKSIEHNIRLMAGFHPDKEFGNIIEAARSERQWKNQRTYISIFAEYSKYMTEHQKAMTLNFLYEMLLHREGDIRNHAANVMGSVISNFSEEFKKELPEGIMAPDMILNNLSLFEMYLDKIINPDYRYTEQHKKWINNCMSAFVSSSFASCTDSVRHRYLEVVKKYYLDFDYDENIMLVLIKTLIDLDESLCNEDFVETVAAFLVYVIDNGTQNTKLAALIAAKKFVPDFTEARYFEKVREILGISHSWSAFESNLGNMFLNDLKAGTSWIIKITNISLMLNFAESSINNGYLLHIATHFANLVKVSETITVRKWAGCGLLSIVELLPMEQRNEIAVELFNGLEIGDYQFSKYIPDYLGRIMLELPPQELDEFIKDMKKILESGNEKAASAVLNTLAVIVSNYSVYERRFKEDKKIGEKRKNLTLNMIMKSFASYKSIVAQEAFWVVGMQIFDSETMSYGEKAEVLVSFGKKILAILAEKKEKSLDFFNNAATLNKIYKFIAKYQSDIGSFVFPKGKKVAFFPGTFDPFSLGHKAIAMTIRDMGMEVYLALDEFSWSKKTQPRLQRRKIMMMSIAGQDDIYIFPEDIPVNIANPKDIARLKATFPDNEVYIAVGSDVVKNASCYRGEPSENSIHSVNHIIFSRDTNNSTPKPKGAKQNPITADIINLSLPKTYEDISSTKIRENIDSNRDISNLIDNVAQSYIYEKNLYLREPEYKHVLQAQDLYISKYGIIPEKCLKELESEMVKKGHDYKQVCDHVAKKGVNAVYLQSGDSFKKAIAMATAHGVDTDSLYEELQDIDLAAKVREKATGKIASIGIFIAKKTKAINNINQFLITEILTELRARDYTYVIYNPIDEAGEHGRIIEDLKRQGFVNIAPAKSKPIYAVDMRSPIIIFKDVEKAIKNPLNKNPRVLKVMEDAHNRLLQTITDLYPGQLVLSFNTSAVYNKIMFKIAMLNKVPTIKDPRGRRGPYMSVPFGEALTGVVVPNTVTKALHTEKYFNENITGFRIGERKYYSALDNQAKTIKSFNKPVILIDDLLHKGYRIEKISPILKRNEVDIRAVVTGVLTGNAKDMMKVRGVTVESAYYLPSIKLWLNERDCYPFIGGDRIDGVSEQHVNLVMPFAYPNFIKRGDGEAVYRYSMTCLENAYEILKVLEQEYQKKFEKKLTLKRLGEVITYPRRPELGEGVLYDESLAPSTFVAGSITKLIRMGSGKQKEWTSLG